MTTAARRAKLDLTITARAGRTHVNFLKKMLRRAHALLPNQLNELSIALVADRQMSKLHQKFMNDSSPTDVLTFPLEADSRGRATSGEIVINVSQARRESRRRGIAVRNELLLYALHGILHLMGMDDRTDPDFDRMHRLEDRILGRLGVGAVFNTKKGENLKREN
jgi:probable rRNA maturation factor